MKALSVVNLLAACVYLASMFHTVPHSKRRSLPLSTPEYKKLILIVFDGLRADGAFRTANKGAYFNKMPALHSLRGYKALSLCSNPTLTSVRIGSMVKCTPSNFLDGLCAFSHAKSEVPNFFDSASGKSLLFFGDETWKDLFGIDGRTYNAYGKNFSLDQEVEYMGCFRESVGSADILIGHFSALDNYGHVLTTKHPKMGQILTLFDGLVESVYERMCEDTLLVITSDHGVTDNGDHGGASVKERSSFVYFVDKRARPKDFPYPARGPETKWINAQESFDVVGQEDIFPTICALMGVAIPFNSFGDLIFPLINDPDVYANYALQKMKRLGMCPKEAKEKIEELARWYCQRKSVGVSPEDSGKPLSRKKRLEFYRKLNKQLSKEMRERLCSVNNFLVCLSMLATFISCLCLARPLRPDASLFLLIVVIVMASHSVYCFIHEDLLWSALFLFRNCGLNNLFVCFAAYFIGKYPQHSQDRWVPGRKVGTHLGRDPCFLLLVALSSFMRRFIRNGQCIKTGWLFGLFHSIKRTADSYQRRLHSAFMQAPEKRWALGIGLFSPSKKKGPFSMNGALKSLRSLGLLLCSVSTELVDDHLTMFLLFRYLFPSYLKEGVNLDFFLSHPSLSTLLVLVYDPPSAFFVIRLLPLATHNTLSSHYSLAQVLFFVSGFNYDMSSISTEIPHVFSKDFSLVAAVLLTLYSLFYLRVKTVRATREYMAVSALHAFAAQAVAYVTYNEMVYLYFFVGRCLFMMAYFMLDNTLYLLGRA